MEKKIWKKLNVHTLLFETQEYVYRKFRVINMYWNYYWYFLSSLRFWLLRSKRHTNFVWFIFTKALNLTWFSPFLLETCKVIFVSRNPKDCCVSYFHHHNIFPGYYFKGNFEEFSKFFMNGVLQYGNYWTILKVNLL